MLCFTSGVLVALLLAMPHAGQAGQSADGILERIAARAALERVVSSSKGVLRVGVAPVIVRGQEAPGARDSVARLSARMDALAHELNARVVTRDQALDCANRRCALRNLDVFVTLAEPWVRDDSASVSVTTVVQRKNRRAQYQTVNVILGRRAGVWRVVGFEDLGVS